MHAHINIYAEMMMMFTCYHNIKPVMSYSCQVVIIQYLWSLLMLYWLSLCVLRRTCRHKRLYEILFQTKINKKVQKE
jgi:hypothetical protein